MKSKFYLFMILISALSFAQKKEFNSAVVKINKYIEGSLVTPYSEDNVPLVIFYNGCWSD